MRQRSASSAYRPHANWARDDGTAPYRHVAFPPRPTIQTDTVKFIARTIYIIDAQQKSESAHSSAAEFGR